MIRSVVRSQTLSTWRWLGVPFGPTIWLDKSEGQESATRSQMLSPSWWMGFSFRSSRREDPGTGRKLDSQVTKLVVRHLDQFCKNKSTTGRRFWTLLKTFRGELCRSSRDLSSARIHISVETFWMFPFSKHCVRPWTRRPTTAIRIFE